MKGHGGQTAICEEVKQYIIKYINVCSEWGYPLGKYDLIIIIKGYQDQITNPDIAKVFTETSSLVPKTQLLSAEDALAVLIDAKLSREQYDVIRKCAPDKFPSYKTVQAAKKCCYPKDIRVNETSASVSLQALLNHTTERSCQTLTPVNNSLQKNY